MNMSTMKKAIASLLAAMFAFGTAIAPAGAATKTAPKVKDVEYEGKGVVQVEFRHDVRYRNVNVTVKDAEGT